jgi:hypothetical protein
MKSFVCLKPALDSLVFVGRIVIADEVNLLVCDYRLVDHAQELELLLMAVLLRVGERCLEWMGHGSLSQKEKRQREDQARGGKGVNIKSHTGTAWPKR